MNDLQSNLQQTQTDFNKKQKECQELQEKLATTSREKDSLELALSNIEKNVDIFRSEEVKHLVARVKVDDIGYTLVLDNNEKLTWFVDKTIVNIREKL